MCKNLSVQWDELGKERQQAVTCCLKERSEHLCETEENHETLHDSWTL